MDSDNLTFISDISAHDGLKAISKRADFCMKQYQPFLRKDFSIHHLSMIINVPVPDIENYFSQSLLIFEQYVSKYRVKYSKSLLEKETSSNLEIITIGSLSGFSSTKKFIEAFRRFEGISPKDYQASINQTLSK